MADNYLQFSFEIETTQEQREWMDKRMVSMFDTPILDDDGNELFSDYYDSGRSWQLEHYNTSTVIYAEECGNTEHLVDFLQMYIREWNIDEPIGVEWAMTCSKMRPNEFGGGACVVWKDHVQWLGTSDWIFRVANGKG